MGRNKWYANYDICFKRSKGFNEVIQIKEWNAAYETKCQILIVNKKTVRSKLQTIYIYIYIYEP